MPTLKQIRARLLKIDSSLGRVESITALATGSVTATAPALGARCQIGFKNNTAAAATYRVDGIQMELGSVATPYIETDGAAATRQPNKEVAP